MENNTYLKPCPFCGSYKLKVDCVTHYHPKSGYEYTASVRCNKCHARGSTARGGFEDAKERAFFSWNVRLSDMEIQKEAEIETLKAMLDAAERYLHPLPFKDDFDGAVDKARTEAIREFAERLCNGRVSNDPVVIAVNCALEEMTEE